MQHKLCAGGFQQWINSELMTPQMTAAMKDTKRLQTDCLQYLGKSSTQQATASLDDVDSCDDSEDENHPPGSPPVVQGVTPTNPPTSSMETVD